MPFFASVLLGGHFHDVLEASVEGANGVVAYGIGDFGDGGVAALQHLGSTADAQGIDVIVEAGVKLSVKEMGDVISADMKLVGDGLQGNVRIVILVAEMDDALHDVRFARAVFRKGHKAEKLTEQNEQMPSDLGVGKGGAFLLDADDAPDGVRDALVLGSIL